MNTVHLIDCMEHMAKLPKHPICPTCGKPAIEYMYGGAGCKPCGVMFRYNDKWIQEGK